jgi:hypothetical protein
MSRLLLFLFGVSALASPAAAAPPRVPTFAQRLTVAKQRPAPTLGQALVNLGSASLNERQSARWDYARAALAAGRVPETLGALDTMQFDEPDIELVASFALVRGQALATLHRSAEALSALSLPQLLADPEACAWRTRALAEARAAATLGAQLACAIPALNARRPADRLPFLIPAADLATDSARPDLALHWLSAVPARDSGALLVRARAYLIAGQTGAAATHFAAAAFARDPAIRAGAELGSIQAGLAARTLAPAAAAQRLDALVFSWRGDRSEDGALWTRWDLARASNDTAAALRAGATLIRYRTIGSRLPDLMQQVQAILADLLSVSSRIPLTESAGLYWDYRDCSPGGSEGDALVVRLADRLQDAGLYARAADLLDHQLRERSRDLAQGPLSVRVATLQILAGDPDKALAALRDTNGTLFPTSMLHDRQRIEAVALHQLGRASEAMAVLENVPGGPGLLAEFLWHDRDWTGFAAVTGASLSVGGPLPAAGSLGALGQAMVLRQAIALGMTNQEGKLAALRARYAVTFAALSTAAAFDQLTRPATTIDPTKFTAAMAAIPTVSPAGAIADLLEAAPSRRKN